MQPCYFVLVLASVLALPVVAQTKVWSEAPTTQRWSETPAPPPAPSAPAPKTPPGYTQNWAQPVTTQRRSDADVQRQVDAIAEDAKRRAAAGQGAWAGQQQSQPTPQDQAWRNHMERSRAQDQLQRDQDEYYRRQREFQQR